jgi:hypothetical protein
MWGFTVHQQIHDGLRLASYVTKQNTVNEMRRRVVWCLCTENSDEPAASIMAKQSF